jgi:hypothetical protein
VQGTQQWPRLAQQKEGVMSGRWCPVCRSAQRLLIDADLGRGVEWHRVADTFGLRVEVVAEHWEHLPFSAAPTTRAGAPAPRRARRTRGHWAARKPGVLPWEEGRRPSREETDALIAAILREQLGPLPGLD